MANWTKAELSARVLKYLNVVGAGQTATADDDTATQETIDSVYKRLRKLGLAPFATSAIPEYAQNGLRKIVAYEVAPLFGISQATLVSQTRKGPRTIKEEGEDEIRQYLAGPKHPVPIRTEYF